MNENSGIQKRGTLFRVILPAALLGAGMGVGGWTVASNWNAEAAPRAPAAKARPAAGATKYDRVLGNVYYKVPPGYRAVRRDSGIYMARQAEIDAGAVKGALIVTSGLPFTDALREQMHSAGKTAFLQGIAVGMSGLADDPDAKISEPQSVNDAAKDGYEGYSMAILSRDKDDGKKRLMQIVIALTGNRIEGFMRAAYGEQDNLDALGPGFEALASSIEFKNAGAPPPTRLAAALPTDIASIQPKPNAAPAQSASGGKKGGKHCRSTIESSCVPAYGGGLSCLPYPAVRCN